MNSETFRQNKKKMKRKILKYKLWNISKNKEKKNTQIQRTFFPGHSLSTNRTKHLQHFIFSIPFFLVSFVWFLCLMAYQPL